MHQGDPNRLGTVIAPEDLPEPYNTYKVIDVGSTAVILEDPDDANYVYAITRDEAKKSWLVDQWGLGIGSDIESFMPENLHDIEEINGMMAHVIRMPRFFKIDASEERRIMQMIPKLLEGNDLDAQRMRTRTLAMLEHDPKVKKFILSFSHLFDFLKQLGMDYQLDIQPKNIMKDAAGDYVLLDPIMDDKIFTALVGDNARKALAAKTQKDIHNLGENFEYNPLYYNWA